MLDRVKQFVKARLPKPILDVWGRARRTLQQWEFKRLDRRETFSRIYAKNLWGGERGEFCSGLGSTDEHAEGYAAMVREYIATHGIRSVVDLGCGDFRVASRFVGPGLDYTGLDIVPDLVAHNQSRHGSASVRFATCDILVDALPKADLCLVRQVLQHLSNAEISMVLERLSGFGHVIVTEHIPAPGHVTTPNRDKPHGPDTRLPEGSGVFLEHPPFAVKGLETLLDVPANQADASGGRIRSQVFQPARQAR